VGKTILLVDDNPDDVFLTQRALKKCNIAGEIVVANDGSEALDYLFGTGKYSGRDLSQMPASTLLDLKMPRISGIEVLRRLRENPRTRLLPVVILTTSREETDILQCYSSGCNAYVRKPVDFEKFAEAIKQLAIFWMVLNETPAPQRN